MAWQGRTGAVTLLFPGLTDETRKANRTVEEFEVLLRLCSGMPTWQLFS